MSEHFLLFYRVSHPVGWNIANGGAHDARELLAPELVLHREFGEEVLVADDEQEILYSFDPGHATKEPGYQSAAIKAWALACHPRPNYTKYQRRDLPIKKWAKGPDRVQATVWGDTLLSSGFFLSITPKDNAIEVDRVAYIELPEQVKFLDGDVSPGVGRQIGRPIGLFECKRFLELLGATQESRRSGSFIPDILFFQGRMRFAGKGSLMLGDFEAVRNEYLDLIDPTKQQSSLRTNNMCPPGLCPITESLVRRYRNLCNDDKVAWVPVNGSAGE